MTRRRDGDAPSLRIHFRDGRQRRTDGAGATASIDHRRRLHGAVADQPVQTVIGAVDIRPGRSDDGTALRKTTGRRRNRTRGRDMAKGDSSVVVVIISASASAASRLSVIQS